MVSFMQDFQKLYSTLQHSSSAHGQTHIQMAPRVLQARVRHLRQDMNQQLALLGMYQAAARASATSQRQKSAIDRSSTHIAMDNIWWDIRRSMDEYLAASDQQVNSYDATLSLLESYRSCETGITELQDAYQRQHDAREKSVELLQKTFHDVSYDAGRLAGIMTDSNIFAECDRAEANAEMFNAVSIAALFLLERHEDLGLPPPDLEVMRGAHRDISQAWKVGEEQCKSDSLNLVQEVQPSETQVNQHLEEQLQDLRADIAGANLKHEQEMQDLISAIKNKVGWN